MANQHHHSTHRHQSVEHSAHNHHDHSHGHHHHAPKNFSRAFAIGLILNLGFVIVEAGYGWAAHSISLLADAGHNLSDVLGLVVAWVASILSRRQPSGRYTYGWRRSSILAALFNAMFLLVAVGGLSWEALQRFRDPAPVAGGTVIVVAAIGIVINTITALLFMSGRKTDLNIRAAFLHMASDAIVSLGVVLAGVTILFTQWLWVDPAFSLVVNAIIVVGTWQLLKDSLSLAMDAVPAGVDERIVRAYLAEQSGVSQVHDLHIWGMSTTETALTAHLVIPEGHPGDRFLAHLCQELRSQFGIDHATIQIELGDSTNLCHLAPDHVV
ncbi:cation transporter [Phormidium sp. CLA17]|uniref:cation diffusion facilitator family transporter n=1 Tax=Leptolyngbya sp. Cla-17 TaxID=2803751 RepID=UPI0014930A7F|nr:cation diffusion facilitator family transporter [Leptolyngbya sp. Cla-17]MBM0742825.1 cation transporter [Leptolyngbya sp. Cla-17]